MARGSRLDEAGPGHGLAIASDLMQVTGGAITLDQSALGGLEARLAWPIEQLSATPREADLLRRLTRR